MAEADTPLVDVARLRVGMFIYIDLSWQHHPFPFNSFKLRNADQIATLRSLGLEQVRWSPDKSDAKPLPEAVVEVAQRAAAGDPATVAAVAPAAAAEAPSRRQQLAAQLAALKRCEAKYDDASKVFRQLQYSVRNDPESARDAAVDVVSSMAKEVEGDHEAAIRLLSEQADEPVSAHAVNVAVLSMLLGRACGLEPVRLREMALGAFFHDIGKLDLPFYLRHGASQLNPEERRAAQKHVEQGVEAGRRMGLPPTALRAIAEHHEFADGSGYPQGLKGEAISPAGRIVALVNHFEGLCNPHSGEIGVTPHDAIALIYAKQRSLFDERTLALFIRLMGVYPPGTAVELNDKRLALVVGGNPGRPLKPRVVVFDGAASVDEADVLDIDAQPGLAVARALRPEQLPPLAFAYLTGRKRLCYYFDAVAARVAVAETPRRPLF